MTTLLDSLDLLFEALGYWGLIFRAVLALIQATIAVFGG